MIKIENTETYGWEAAIRGMRNPLNSWAKSDSFICPAHGGFELVDLCKKCDHVYDKECDNWGNEDHFIIGKNDYDLMKRLRQSGTDHRKFMRMIMVSVDITAPLYWWKEFDTYKVGTVANSCSTMHKIHAKEFTMDDFSHEHLLPHPALDVFETTIEALNTARMCYLECEDPITKKDWWWQMIQLLPSSYNQKRTVTMNYEVLANIYKSRKAHKLDEWREGFCDWIKSLPYSEFITGEFDEADPSIWLASNENK